MKRLWKTGLIGTALALGTTVTGGAAVHADTEDANWPLRSLGEHTGAVIGWNEENATATWSKGDLSVELPIGSSDIKMNSQTVHLDRPVRLEDGKTMVSASFIRSWLGAELDDNGSGRLNEVGLAREFVQELRQGAAGKPLENASEALSGLLPPSALFKAWSGAEQQFGSLQPVAEPPLVEANPLHHSVHLSYNSAAARLDLTVRLDDQGKLDDFQWNVMDPNAVQYKKAEYDDPALYREQEVVIGQKPWQLPGTLTLPAGEGPFPAVVLVHGSGPIDRDGSSGALKPYKDLAAGLAAKGVAVLRYEKRTKEHNAKSAFFPHMTVKEETVDDAVEAARLLLNTPEIDPKRIFAAGHSLGGMMIPRIMKADSGHAFAGAIVLSGPAKPLEEVMADQYDYFAKLGMVPQAKADAIRMQAELLQDPKFDAANPPAAFALGAPYYWKDLRNTHAAEEAKEVKSRLLIVQGGRDYQVPPEHLAIWRAALEGRQDVEFRSYDKLNHMLVEGEGPSIPQEYTKPGNIASDLIKDLADWILQ